MARFKLVTALFCLVLLFASQAHSAIRVNGNQLLEGGGRYGDDRARAASNGAASGPSTLIYTLGMGLMARGTLPDSVLAEGGNTSNAIGIGLGFDIALVVYEAFCPIVITGDIDADGRINSRDLILLVNFLYKGDVPPQPCIATGDVNCSGNVTAADCTYLTNYVFKGGPPPCDVCDIIPSVWNCP